MSVEIVVCSVTLRRKKVNSRQRRACLRNSLLINPFTVISSYFFNHHFEGPVLYPGVSYGLGSTGGAGLGRLPAWGSDLFRTYLVSFEQQARKPGGRNY